MVNLVLGFIVALVGLALYLRSLANRKTFTCPECNESIETEFLDVENCTSCGANFDHKE